MKTAICLVVKNESIEIPYWIAWHKALGFDSFIIYDDYSDDATEETILSLSKYIDIRYKRNAFNKDLHNIRQVRAYNDAVTMYGNDFDWIAFFDADEYLDLYGKTIQDYLKDKENVSLIAFNWSCVGPNGHLNRPEGAPFLNYLRHGTKDLYWNRHTKVLFRPQKLLKPVYQVHNVDVEGLSVDSGGQVVEWESAHGGFTKNSPSWEGGRLIHYQSRSFEHYIERNKHIEDVRRDSGDPLHTITKNKDYSDKETQLSRKYLENFYFHMHKISIFQNNYISEIIKSTNYSFISELKNHFCSKNVAIFDPTYISAQHEVEHLWISSQKKPGNIFQEQFAQSYDEMIFFNIQNYFGKILCSENNELSLNSINSFPLVGVYCKGSDYIHIFPTNGKFFIVKDDPRILSVLTYKVWKNSDGSVSLSHPRTNRFLSFTEDGSYNIRKIRAFAWESFKLLPIAPTSLSPFIKENAFYLSKNNTLTNLKESFMVNEKFPVTITNALTALDPVSKKIVSFLSNGILNEHLM